MVVTTHAFWSFLNLWAGKLVIRLMSNMLAMPPKPLALSLIIFLISGVQVANAQPLTLKGTIFDQTNDVPIAKARVQIQSTAKAVVTDGEGKFQLQVPEKPDTLLVQAAGYAPEKLLLPADTNMLKGLRIGLKASDWQSLQEVVIAGYQMPTTAKAATGNAGIITEQTIDEQSQTTIAPALDQEPGVHYQQGTYSTGRITVRGIGSRSPYSTTKIKAYYQQIPISTGEGVTNLIDQEPAALGRMTVLKGPVSSSYGAGLGGAILLKPQQGQEQGTELSVGSEVGSFGYRKYQTAFEDVGEDYQYQLTYANTQANGFRENSEYNRHSAVFSGRFRPDTSSSIDVLASFTKLKNHIPSSLSRETFEADRTQAADNWANASGYEAYDKTLLGVAYEKELSNALTTTTSVFTHFKQNDEPRPFNKLRATRFTYGARSLTRYDTELGGMPVSVSAGGEVFQESFQRQTFENVDGTTGALLTNVLQDRFYWNAFLKTRVELTDRLTVEAGLNRNKTRYAQEDLNIADSLEPGTPEFEEADQSGSYDFEPIWSPRVGLNYQLSSNYSTYASASRGFARPSVQETLSPSGGLNPDIQPEHGWSYEIGARGFWPDAKLSYRASAFYMRVEDKLVARRVGPDSYIGLNAGATTHQGLELSVKGQHILGRRRANFLPRIQPFVTYNYLNTRFEDFTDRGETYDGNRMPGTAPHFLKAGIRVIPYQQLRGNVHHKVSWRFRTEYRAAMPVNDENSSEAASYQLFHTGLQYRLETGPLHLELLARARNLTDALYASMIVPNIPGYGGSPRYYYPGMPRNYMVGLEAGMDL